MNILVINQFFWPDAAATSQLLADVTRGVDTATHRITAVCGVSNYGCPDGSAAPPVRIIRVGTTRFSRNRVGRLVSYASFFAGAAFRGMITRRPDMVVTLTTPPLISLVGAALQRLRGSKHFIWEMDVYPDIAIDLRVIRRDSFIARLTGTLADWGRRNADGIIVLGEEMKARLMERGIPEHKIRIAENWADGDEIRPAPFGDNGPFVVHYSGNFGLAHEHRTVTEVIRKLNGDRRFRFVFAGDGSRKKHLEELCRREGITNVDFLPYSERAELSNSLARGHVGLVTQLPATSGSVVPSKTYGIMAAGRPILYIGPDDTTPARILDKYQCGWRIDPGDADGMVRLLKGLEQHRGAVVDAGLKARHAFNEKYDRESGIARILGVLGLETAGQPATVGRTY